MSIPDADLSPARFVLDTPALHHFALAERLDVLQDLLLQDDCWTTCVVTGELKERAEEAGQPLLLNAVGLEWLQVDLLRGTGHSLPCTGGEFLAYARRNGLL